MIVELDIGLLQGHFGRFNCDKEHLLYLRPDLEFKITIENPLQD